MKNEIEYFKKNEEKIFTFWSLLTKRDKTDLLNQLQAIDLTTLKEQKRLLSIQGKNEGEIEPFEDFALSGSQENQELGQNLINEGRLGCIVLAGGQGSRLQFTAPKGMYPISLIKGKTLFQLCAERTKAAGKRAGHLLQLAIMTSPENDGETRQYFQRHHFFGLNASQVSFFVQGALPLLDAKGHLFLQTQNQVAMGADGNGQSLRNFARSGIMSDWRKKGIDYAHVILIDNPLADPFDAELLGYHRKNNLEVTLKCAEKRHEDEKVGVLVKKNNRCSVIEYTELSKSEKSKRNPNGHLVHCCANLSLFCFSLSFIETLDSLPPLPMHKSWKSAIYLDENGSSHFSPEPIAWKFETFIFDWLLYANRVGALLYPREECFAPLKNKSGNDSPQSVQQALQAYDRKIIQSLTGLPCPDFPFELAADFYYPTPELHTKWRGRSFTSPYVEI